ncbi:MAG: hypothetical protein GYA87_08630 [Christensenellaceae bacterium]|nr:hypothetical protein [Christensenellaceae bacterium]
MNKKNKFAQNINWERVSLLMKIGILGALINLAGDLLSGWGVRDTTIAGIEGLVSQYLTMPDGRMFWSAMLGLFGAPISVFGHLSIYKLIKPFSRKYAKLYGIGMVGCLALGGSGVHMSSLASAFFYKYITLANPEHALAVSIKFVRYFSLPLYILFFIFWFIAVYAHIKAITGAFSPYPRRGWVFSMPVGALFFSLVNVFGNHAIVNAIMVGALTLGNIWMLGGHLLMLSKVKENWGKSTGQ